jgi:hypothetical protein
MGVCLRLTEASDPKDGIKECIKGDAWFGSARDFDALGEKGYRAFLQIKGNKGLHPNDFIEKAMSNMPGRTKIVLKGNHPNGVPLVAIGYRYSMKMTLFFIMMEDAGRWMLLFMVLLLLSLLQFI